MDGAVLILGGYGNAGRAIADLLACETGVTMILAGRQLQQAQALAGTLNARYGGRRVLARYADAADCVSLRRAFEGVALVIVASCTIRHTLAVAEAALAAHADYFDLLLSSRRKLDALRSLAGKVEQAGSCFITDGGFHPGLPAALVRYAARHFDEMHSAITAGVMRLPWSRLSVSGDSIQEFVEEFADYSPVSFAQGRWGKNWSGSRIVDFGAPFGRVRCSPMAMNEMFDLPARVPSLQETGFYVAGFNVFADYVAIPVLMLALKLSPNSTRWGARFFRWSVSTFSKPPFGLVLQLDALGVSEGRPKRLRLRLSHEDGYVFTAAPVVACLKQYFSGSIRIPGLHCQANLVEPSAFLRDMRGMGIRVIEEVL